MGFEDLKSRKFTVTEADALAKHASGDIVTFEGSGEEVIIKCKRYPYGVYENGKIAGGTKEEGDAYTITIIQGDRLRIKFELDPQEGSGGSGGSWTAEDMPTEPGNG